MSLFVFYGPDQFRVREELRAVRAKLDTADGNLTHNTVRLEARGLTPGDLRSASQTASFFAEDRLVVVEGLQARLSGSRRRGRTAAARTREAPASDLEQFVDVLSNLPPTTTVVLLDENPANAFIESLSGATVRQFPIIKGGELRTWVTQRARSHGADFAPNALDRLVALIDGHHLGELAQEINKLATYVNGRRIEVAHVDELVSGAVQYQIWDLTDSVIEGRGERALAVLKAMDARDHPRQLLIFMLVRQYRQLMLAQAHLRDGLGADQIGTELRLSGFPLRKVIEQASHYPADRLEIAYRRLLETDVAVKTGILEIDTAIELLILDLAELAKAPRGRVRR